MARTGAMSNRHEPGTLIGTSPGIRTQVSKGRPLVFTLPFFPDNSEENRPLNNKTQGKKAKNVRRSEGSVSLKINYHIGIY
jgi:hypothetical protein